MEIYSLRVSASAMLNKDVVLQVIQPDLTQEQIDLNKDFDHFSIFSEISK